MLTEFLSWWTRQMLDLVPERFLRRDPAASNAILATPDASRPGELGAVLLTLRRNGQEQIVGRQGARDAGTVTWDAAGKERAAPSILRRLLHEHPNLPLLLRLPSDSLLTRDVSLPLAAEAGYERVLQYEMDRLTPFAAADVFWSAQPLRRNKETGRLDLRLSLVPRAWLAAPLATLQEAGGRPAAIEVRGRAGAAPQRIALAHEPGRTRIVQQRLLAAALGACAVLALLAVTLPFMLQAGQAARADHRMAALQPQVREVEALRARILSGTAGMDTIARVRGHLGDPIGLLASLTRVLPDDTYLTDVTLHDGVLTLTGQSPGAVKLIPSLSADPAFVAPAFSAPVTRIESNNSDLFSIRAEVAPASSDPR